MTDKKGLLKYSMKTVKKKLKKCDGLSNYDDLSIKIEEWAMVYKDKKKKRTRTKTKYEVNW